MTHLTRAQLIMLTAGGSAAILAGAYIFQALGYPPCKLCWWQRYPHFAAAGIGILALVFRGALLPWLGAIAAAITSGIGFYHSGVERKLWEGPTSCTSSGVEGMSTQDLMDQIMAAPLIRCDEIPWEMFGVTMANLNFLFSAAFAVIWVMAARR